MQLIIIKRRVPDMMQGGKKNVKEETAEYSEEYEGENAGQCVLPDKFSSQERSDVKHCESNQEKWTQF